MITVLFLGSGRLPWYYVGSQRVCSLCQPRGNCHGQEAA